VLRQHGGPGPGPRGLVGVGGGLDGRIELARAQEAARGSKQATRARQEFFDRLAVVDRLLDLARDLGAAGLEAHDGGRDLHL